MASALEFLDCDGTQQTRLFIRMIDRFFDYLNVRSPVLGHMKRKESIAPYKSPSDYRFKVCVYKICMHTHTANMCNCNSCILNVYFQWLATDFLGYLDSWEKEVADQPGIERKEKQRMCLSKETLQGLRITGKCKEFP